MGQIGEPIREVFVEPLENPVPQDVPVPEEIPAPAPLPEVPAQVPA